MYCWCLDLQFHFSILYFTYSNNRQMCGVFKRHCCAVYTTLIQVCEHVCRTDRMWLTSISLIIGILCTKLKAFDITQQKRAWMLWLYIHPDVENQWLQQMYLAYCTFQSKFIHPSMTGKALCIACVGIHLALETGLGVSYQSNLLLLLL